MRSQISNCSSKYPPFSYVLCIQPDNGHLASRNMYRVLILICKNNVVCLQNTFILQHFIVIYVTATVVQLLNNLTAPYGNRIFSTLPITQRLS